MVATFRDEAARVGRGLRERMEARRPGTTVRTSLSPPAQVTANYDRPRSEREPVVSLGIAWYGDPNRMEVGGVVLEWATGTGRTTGSEWPGALGGAANQPRRPRLRAGYRRSRHHSWPSQNPSFWGWRNGRGARYGTGVPPSAAASKATPNSIRPSISQAPSRRSKIA